MGCSKKVPTYQKMARIGREIDPEKETSILCGMVQLPPHLAEEWNGSADENYSIACSVLGLSEYRHLKTISDRCGKIASGTSPVDYTIAGLAMLGLAYVRIRLLSDMDEKREDMVQSPPAFDFLTDEQRDMLEAEYVPFFADHPSDSPLAKIMFFDKRIRHYGWHSNPLE